MSRCLSFTNVLSSSETVATCTCACLMKKSYSSRWTLAVTVKYRPEKFNPKRKLWSFIHPHVIPNLQASPCPNESNKVLLNDGSCWTIIGTEVVEYTFSESLTSHPTTISPVPVIHGLEVRKTVRFITSLQQELNLIWNSMSCMLNKSGLLT